MTLVPTSQGEVFCEILGDGSPLVLLHADAASGIEYASVTDWLARRHRVILVDFPGCGRSPRRAFSSEYHQENAKAVIEVVRKFTQQPAWIVGNGGGAVVGLWTALLAPAVVRGVVADSFVEFLDRDDVQKDLMAHQEPTQEMIAFWREMNGDDWRTVIDQLDRVCAALADHKRSLFNWRLEEIHCPVLATGSRKDHLLSDLARRMLWAVEQIPHGKLVLYPEGGHPSMWSQAEHFWPDCLAYIRAHQPAD